MDLLRPRAIPALIAAALAAGAAHADCSALAGTYAFRPEASATVTEERTLASLVEGDRRKLFKAAAPSGSAQSWTSGAPRARAKAEPLATAAAFKANEAGGTFTFLDDKGAALASLGIGQGWACKGDRLLRGGERMVGAGEVIRTDRVEEALFVADGHLVYDETVTPVEPRPGKAQRQRYRFRKAG